MRSFNVLALVIAATLALGACAKGGNSAGTASSAAAQTTSAAQAGNPDSNGAKVYATNCASCHQADGKGVAGAFPPLAGNPAVTGDPEKVIRIVKYGLNGKIEVEGHAFNGMMPSWDSQLSNAQIADAVAHIRSSWGNSASAVTEAQVAATTK